MGQIDDVRITTEQHFIANADGAAGAAKVSSYGVFVPKDLEHAFNEAMNATQEDLEEAFIGEDFVIPKVNVQELTY